MSFCFLEHGSLWKQQSHVINTVSVLKGTEQSVQEREIIWKTETIEGQNIRYFQSGSINFLPTRSRFILFPFERFAHSHRKVLVSMTQVTVSGSKSKVFESQKGMWDWNLFFLPYLSLSQPPHIHINFHWDKMYSFLNEIYNTYKLFKTPFTATGIGYLLRDVTTQFQF